MHTRHAQHLPELGDLRRPRTVSSTFRLPGDVRNGSGIGTGGPVREEHIEHIVKYNPRALESFFTTCKRIMAISITLVDARGILTFTTKSLKVAPFSSFVYDELISVQMRTCTKLFDRNGLPNKFTEYAFCLFVIYLFINIIIIICNYYYYYYFYASLILFLLIIIIIII